MQPRMFFLISLTALTMTLCCSCWLTPDSGSIDEELLAKCNKYCNLYYKCINPSLDFEFDLDTCKSECDEYVRDSNPLTPDLNLLYCTNFSVCSDFSECVESVNAGE